MCKAARWVVVCAMTFASAGAFAADPADFGKSVTPMLERFCYECHGGGNTAGDLELDAFKSADSIRAAKPTVEKALLYLRGQIMPPPEADRHPSQKERDALAKALTRHLYNIDPAHPDPGRVTIRRLNRTEYRNIIRELTGVSFDPTVNFPEDDTGYGFDNIADVLTLPPMLMEKYLAATDKILDEAIPAQQAEHVERRVAAIDARANFNRDGHVRDGWIQLNSDDEDALSVQNESQVAAEFRVRVLAYAHYPESPPVGLTEHPPMKFSIMLGDAVVREVDVTADEAKPQWYEARIGVPAGKHVFRAAVKRIRNINTDRAVTAGRLGAEQPGSVRVKEFLIDGPLAGAVRRIDGKGMQLTGNARRIGEDDVMLHKDNDEAAAAIEVAKAGKYLLRAQAYAEYAGNEPAKIDLLLDGKSVRVFDVGAPAARKPSPADKDLADAARRAVPRVYETQATLAAGKHRLAARFINNLRDEANADPNYRDRNVVIQHLEVVELGAAAGSVPMTAPMGALFAKYPKPADARALLTEFARRAWRRPASEKDLDRLMTLYDLARKNDENHQASVRHAMKAVLVSMNFLFHGELDSPQQNDGQPHQISEIELASRLSFFLWSSMPDEELLSLAERGELRAKLDDQVKRMLASPKASALVENFAGQWLQFRNLDAAHPNPKKFEEYDDRLRDSMQRETQLFFNAIMREDRSILDVLTGDYTFVNEKLAKHYGIADVKGNEFRRVSLKDTPRRGVLTQGSVLTLTSNPTRTSPVKRGKWVLENLLGVAPPPPPPDVPALIADGKKLEGSLRKQLEMHRADPMCSSCHAPMDPIGLSLENFNAIGAWRDKDGDAAIDASASMPDGTKFTGPAELAKMLAETRRDDFYRAATAATMTFALGRGVEPTDEPAVDKIIENLQQNDGKFSSLVMGVIHSVPFQMRRSDNTAQASR